MRNMCVAVGLDPEAVRELDALVTSRIHVKKRHRLYRAGDSFTDLFAIRVGTFKTLALTEDGREQVTGYHMGGEIVGLDGLADDRYACEAIALEDSEVCVLPFGNLDRLAHRVPRLQDNLYRLIARRAGHRLGVMLMLGSMHAEERLVTFLLDLSARFRERGYSPTAFILRMSREDIASYLGLKLETVSRLFSRLQGDGLIQVQGRAIKLLDPTALRAMIGQRG